MSAKKKLDAYLAEIFKQFIAIKDDDFKSSQEVFKSVFELLKSKMAEQCNFFKKYSGQVVYAGSVYDSIKVSRLDEFDMDIIIRLPINQLDEGKLGVIMENGQPGFVTMRIYDGFDNIDRQPEWEKCHVVTKDWRDSSKYFLQNKFKSWLHKIVQRALNDLNSEVTVNGVKYALTYRESGPAFTLNIRNSPGQDTFVLDVDLVPVIKFVLPRWPQGYRKIENSQVKDWLVVPKPNKAVKEEEVKNRCWRLSFQEFEREMMKGCNQLKTTIRLVKKLRDALRMKAIASYYIKTLFLWKIADNDKKYWQTKISVLFQTMVKELHDAIEIKKIPYFWHKDNNLIEGMKPTHQSIYLGKLAGVLKSLESNDVHAIVTALLTESELQEFKKSEFYQQTSSKPSRDAVINSAPVVSVKKTAVEDGAASDCECSKIDMLLHRITALEERLKHLEMARTKEEQSS